MSDCSCVYVDGYDSPSVFNERWRTAIKVHKCCECGRDITVGEKYYYAFGVWDGRRDTHKTCADCLSVREVFFCNGFVFEGLWEYMHSHVMDGDCSIDADCLTKLTPAAREKVCEMVEKCWESFDYDDE